jgi:hypothetical protein
LIKFNSYVHFIDKGQETTMKIFARRKIFLLVIGVLLFIPAGMVFANHASGSWHKNGVNMWGNHHVEFGPGTLERQMWSNSSGHAPSGLMQTIFADARLKDRCQNSDGTWATWNVFAYQPVSENWVYSVGTYTKGQYQTCSYGHQYKNRSLHFFRHDSFGVNDYYWLCSAICN